jgi:very-short-patch-repair endonuclease
MASATGERSDPRTPKARHLRRDATPPERKLWPALKALELPQGHFRRQAPIGPYFADFAHHGLRLVVELDGAQHGFDKGVRRDAVRTAYLEAAGYRVIRFWNNEIRENLDGVVETIIAALAEPPPTPSPSPPLARRAGGGGSDTPRLDAADGACPC